MACTDRVAWDIPKASKQGFSVKLNNFKIICSKMRKPLSKLTCHLYSGWEDVLGQAARRRRQLPAQWLNDRDFEAGEASANICSLPLCQTQHGTVTLRIPQYFLGALNLMTYHPVPARYIWERSVSSSSLLQSSIVCCEQLAEVNWKTWMLLIQTWRHWVMAPN